MIPDVSLYGKIIQTHPLTRIGCKWHHSKIHELIKMAEAMRKKDN